MQWAAGLPASFLSQRCTVETTRIFPRADFPEEDFDLNLFSRSGVMEKLLKAMGSGCGPLCHSSNPCEGAASTLG